MFPLRIKLLLCLGMILSPLIPQAVQALPGQSREVVSAWMEANPTLKPAVPGRLIVERSNTPAQRFRFQAMIVPPGRITEPPDPGVIRTELFSLYDEINGVTRERLGETLRSIYGTEIYQDFLQGEVVYSYPTAEMLELSRRQNLPLVAAQQGQLHLGNHFAYWVEVTETNRGMAYNGRMTILLKEDLEKVLTELQNR